MKNLIKKVNEIKKKYINEKIEFEDAWCSINHLLIESKDNREADLYHELYMIRSEVESIENRKIFFSKKSREKK